MGYLIELPGWLAHTLMVIGALAVAGMAAVIVCLIVCAITEDW